MYFWGVFYYSFFSEFIYILFSMCRNLVFILFYFNQFLGDTVLYYHIQLDVHVECE